MNVWCKDYPMKKCQVHSISVVRMSGTQYLCGMDVKLYLCAKKLVCTAQYVCGGKFSLHCI